MTNYRLRTQGGSSVAKRLLDLNEGARNTVRTTVFLEAALVDPGVVEGITKVSMSTKFTPRNPRH